jgi:hypothetical protein
MAFLIKKLVPIVIIAVIGVVATVLRMVSRANSKRSQGDLIDKLKHDPKLVGQMAESLDYPYGKVPLSGEVFDLLRRNVTSLAEIGPYKILYAANFGAIGVLLFTEMTFTDFQITATGKHDDVTEKAFHNFSLQYDRATSTMTVRSGPFFDTTGKFHKEDFVKHLRELSYK